MSARQIGLVEQGADESLQYDVTTTVLGGSPSSIVVQALDLATMPPLDVTSTVFPSGTASVSGDVITLPFLTALTVNHTYQINVAFTSGVNHWDRFFVVRCTR